jgi:hypothetical protein
MAWIRASEPKSPKFKIGDKIRVVSSSTIETRKYIGSEGVVLERFNMHPATWLVSIDDRRHWWAESNLEFAIMIEGQVCASCKIPCPHQKPNQKNGTFVCSSCVFIKELEK